MGARWIEGVGFNLYGVFSIAFLTSAAIGLPRTKALLIVTATAFIMIFMIPFFGRLSDRVGSPQGLHVGLRRFPGCSAFPPSGS